MAAVLRSGLSQRDQIRRAQAEASLPAFIQWAWPMVDPSPWVYSWHIGLLGEYLEAAILGEIRVLIINVPPGHQKSLTVSVFLQPWAWLRWPALRFMTTSYREPLALRDAMKARGLIRDPEFQRFFGDRFQIVKGKDTASRYENDHLGYRYSCAVAGIMGEGGDVVVVDDPHNVQQAESDEVRDETVRQLNLAVPTRIRSSTGALIVMMQRLHSRDYTEALLEQGEELLGNTVHVCLPARYEHDHPRATRTITLPSGRTLRGDPREVPGVIDQVLELKKARTAENAKAIAELCTANDGELLMPELFDEDRVRGLEVALGVYGTAGQLQQRPTARGGGLFERAWFDEKVVPRSQLPRQRYVCRAYDLAGSTRKTSPYTVGVKMAIDARANIYIEHVSRFRGTPGQVRARMKQIAQADGHRVTIDIPQDPGQAGKDQVASLARLLHGFVVRSSPETGDKVARADPFAGQCEAGNVYLVEGPWVQDYLDELESFPTGTYKDQVDATSRGYGRLLQSGGQASSGASSGSY